MIRGVLFDMDGLMFDTEALGLKGWKAAGRKIGILRLSEGLEAVRNRNASDR